jgi:hypothetical protein
MKQALLQYGYGYQLFHFLVFIVLHHNHCLSPSLDDSTYIYLFLSWVNYFPLRVPA